MGIQDRRRMATRLQVHLCLGAWHRLPCCRLSLRWAKRSCTRSSRPWKVSGSKVRARTHPLVRVTDALGTGVVEHVRDGASMHVLLGAPHWKVVPVCMSGIRTPTFKRPVGTDQDTMCEDRAEPYAEEVPCTLQDRIPGR